MNNEKITELLLTHYPEGKCALQYTDAFELLVSSRLSAQCTDIRVNAVTSVMFKTMKTPADFASAEVEDIEKFIHSCGLYHTKARDIKAMSQLILDRFDGEVPNNMDDLLSLPGVGRKIANLIMGEVYKSDGVIIADTHCIRLSNRLGYCKTENQNIVERELRKVVPPEKSLLFCHALVSHGRSVCTARKPDCEGCFLNRLCPSAVLSDMRK